MIAPQRSATTKAKPGYVKIMRTCEIARENYNLPYVWVDTCCINKDSSAILSEAINSMYRWYKDSWICLVYLSDVTDSQLSFHQARWFTRGWTLQELIAPTDLVFFDREWEFRGTKKTMATHVSMITGIPSQILDHSVDLSEIPVAQRFAWASTRETTREEDGAYSLLGLFDINMAMLYGEGPKAFIRLQEHILSEGADTSLFLWSDLRTSQEFTGLLAPSAACFREMRSITAEPSFTQREIYLTNRGIRLKLGLAWDATTGLAILPVKHSFGTSGKPAGVYLRRVGLDTFVRARPNECVVADSKRFYNILTAVKCLSSSQSKRIVNNAMSIIAAREVSIMQVEPPGSWDSSSQLFYGTHTSAFIGYMAFQKSRFPQFAVILFFQDNHWSAIVEQGERWTSIQATFYSYYNYNRDDLKYHDSMGDQRLAYIKGPHSTALTVYLRIKESTGRPYIEIKTFDEIASNPSSGAI
ncbi:hypothetical protein DE146DRAFT_616302 [Phaeosphaeria sp. MPI-PUGE-AT-0046c]|nr:hypothetical protein DE146DRAFT_616302 [Phaeosphaeria sp. MPI-PUGE-AT-0046c]